MISGTNSASTTASRDLLLEDAHRRRRQHLAEEQRGQPAGALLDHAWRSAMSMYGSSSASDPPIRWMSLRRRRFRHVEHVVDGDDADQHAGRVGDRQRGAVVAAGTTATAVSWSSVAFSATNRRSIRSATLAGRATSSRNSRIRMSSISSALLVDDVDDVERFAVLAVRADVVEHLADGPVLADRDVVRRHQPADRALGIAEQRRARRRVPPASAATAAAAWRRPAAPRGTSCGRRAPCC